MLILATNQIIEVWRHSDMWLIAWSRESMTEVESLDQPFYVFKPLYRLLLCPWCCSIWVGLFAASVIEYQYGSWLLTALAVSRGANLLNDLTYGFVRTPKQES